MSQCEYDIIIVGLGAAGSVLATRLIEHTNLKIAIIEAGADYTKNPYVTTPATFAWLWNNPLYPPPFNSPPYDPPFDEWSFNLAGINELYGVPYQYPRGVGYGGSASHNALVPWRGSSKVYDNWAEITGDPSWNYESMLQYFKKTESNQVYGVPDYKKYHSPCGWLNIERNEAPAVTIDTIKASEQLGLPFVEDFLGNPDLIAGVGYYDIMRNKNGTRASPIRNLFLSVYEKHKNRVKIYKNYLATKILFEQNVAVGVEIAKGPFNYAADTQFTGNLGKLKTLRAKKEVILCGGAINTPQLLMLSGLGPKEHLQSLNIPVIADLPGVGSNLQDNIEVFVNFKLSKPYLLPSQSINSFNVFDPSQPEVQQYQASGKGALSTNVTPAGLTWFSDVVPRDPKAPDLFIEFINVYFADYNISDWIGLGNFDPTSSYQSFIIECSHPVGEKGTIRLRTKNPNDTPIIDESPLANDVNTAIIANGILLVRKLFDQQVPIGYPPPTGEPAITTTLRQKYGAEEALPTAAIPSDVPALQNYIKRNSAYGHHISCTARMGRKDDDYAVTDPKLKVRKVKHLRIVDASVFPEIPSGPGVLPTYAVAEKAAKLIAKRYKC